MKHINEGLLSFIDSSPTQYHAVLTAKKMLLEAGFLPLREEDAWALIPGQGYFVTRNQSCLIAFRMAEHFEGFMVGAAHTDSPNLRIKEDPDRNAEGYTKLDVEGYGGAILRSFLDRPLSVAGRILADTEEGLKSILVNIDRDLMVIPSLAIHMDRGVNEGKKLSIQTDMMPLLGKGKQDIVAMAAESVGVKKEQVLSHDLSVYVRDKARFIGVENEFVMAPRLDDLQCVYGLLQGFLAVEEPKNIPVLCLFDNEEVGSSSRQGVLSTFLPDVLSRINALTGGDRQRYQQMMARSIMVSADNAHGVHPNHPEKAAQAQRPILGEGVVVKFGRGYATTGLSAALFRKLCGEVPTQTYFNHSDTPGGSTLGALASSTVSMYIVDVGLSQLSMHSACETAGREDAEHMAKAMKHVFEGKVPEGLE